MNSCCEDITVFGAGASGVCVGYYAKKSGLSFRIHEATDAIGGNAATLCFKEFRFDTGAHRWHDRYADITTELKNLVGHDLKQIHAPSHIFHNKKLIDFPLSPLNLLKGLGPVTVAKAACEVMVNRAFGKRAKANFEDFAIGTYGRSIAGRFLTNYSEKLWGLSCEKLSYGCAGRRMKGLNLETFIWEALYGSRTKTEHLDGSFYYPKFGIGEILDRWINICGQENIVRRSKVTKIFHNDKKILSVEVNGSDKIMTKYAVTTLPISQFLNILTPLPPEEILELGNSLSYRHLKLVALFIDRPSVTASATIYFPDSEFIFTRLYEPKNRSAHMSPPDQTSLVVEIPCQYDSEYWEMDDRALIGKVTLKLCEMGWIKEKDVMDAVVHPMHYAYPVLELGYENKAGKLFHYLERFNNLAFAGRSSQFEYLHLHDIMKSGKEIVENYKIRLSRDLPDY
jgi:protoporphyrinogen oxidase